MKVKTLTINLRFTLTLFALCSIVYPATVWMVGRCVPAMAEGSLVRRHDGTVAGSLLIGQHFSSVRYFHGRPSAVAYNAAGSGGSNYSLSNPALIARMADSVATASTLDGLTTSTIASDRVYASGSGLDPQITPENAKQQIRRVADARQMSPAELTTIVENHTESPVLGVLGPRKVNVLALNLALDGMPAVQPASRK